MSPDLKAIDGVARLGSLKHRMDPALWSYPSFSPATKPTGRRFSRHQRAPQCFDLAEEDCSPDEAYDSETPCEECPSRCATPCERIEDACGRDLWSLEAGPESCASFERTGACDCRDSLTAGATILRGMLQRLPVKLPATREGADLRAPGRFTLVRERPVRSGINLKLTEGELTGRSASASSVLFERVQQRVRQQQLQREAQVHHHVGLEASGNSEASRSTRGSRFTLVSEPRVRQETIGVQTGSMSPPSRAADKPCVQGSDAVPAGREVSDTVPSGEYRCSACGKLESSLAFGGNSCNTEPEKPRPSARRDGKHACPKVETEIDKTFIRALVVDLDSHSEDSKPQVSAYSSEGKLSGDGGKPDGPADLSECGKSDSVPPCTPDGVSQVPTRRGEPPGKPPGRPPGRPPPGKGGPPARSSGSQSTAAPKMPDWSGPQPPPDWQSERVVNWQPLRQPGRWQGSVWQHVHARIQEEGVTPLPTDVLNRAFMRRADELPRRNCTPRGASERRLPRQRALAADLLHVQLGRQGISEPRQLRWAVGWRTKEAVDVSVGNQELHEDALEALLGLLRVAASEEERLNDPNLTSSAPSEEFLERLLTQAGTVTVLVPRVEMALDMSRFPVEAARLERALCTGIRTMDAVLASGALPVLLEGVLVLGNYVNSSCKKLSSAVGVTLDSLAKLSHTRCLPTKDGNGRAAPRNALELLVKHLQPSQPSFVEQLSKDLDGCRAARDVDPSAVAESLQSLTAQIESLVRRSTSVDKVEGYVEPVALDPERLKRFLEEAVPRLECLKELNRQLTNTTLTLRQWFAEPPSSGFKDMMSNLDALRRALPAVPQSPALPAE
uniref:FH2 domain-containing protein n=1 Tax=Noctiluca scintillans TaxID=2966 RepID=A0A7S1F1W4_NOCSC